MARYSFTWTLKKEVYPKAMTNNKELLKQLLIKMNVIVHSSIYLWFLMIESVCRHKNDFKIR